VSNSRYNPYKHTALSSIRMKPEYNFARFTAPARNTWCGNVSEERKRNAAQPMCDYS